MRVVSAAKKAALERGEHTCNVSSGSRSRAFEDLALGALRDAGYRVTMPRTQVIRALGDSNKPLTANEIHSRIAGTGGRIDSVSVYRILSTLQAVGAVHRIGVVDAFYACGLHADSAHDTQHFVCESCGCVTEVDLSQGTARLVADEAGKLGFESHEIRLEILGLCEHCRTSG